ncbi:MAG: hypothetical protein KC964_01525, partial [Candidatus Omnitrophica bacterium]|nr:hypothetical protein [Candidatus Omnitrophota bacterium]
PGVHDYTQGMRENTYGFLDRWLKGSGDGFPVDEPLLDEELFDVNNPEILVFGGEGVPEATAETVYSIWSKEAATLRSNLSNNPGALPGKLRTLLNMPDLSAAEAVPTDRGFLLTTDLGVQVPVLRIGAGSQTVVWLGEEDFETESKRPEVRTMAEHATVFIVEPRGAGMPGEMHILRHAPIVMGRPLVGMWAYDLLCVVDYLARRGDLNDILVAGRGREMGLACLLATVFDDRIESVAIDQMFSSFVQLVGSGNPASQIPGILKVADIEQMVHAAGPDRVHLNNTKKSKGSGELDSSSLPVDEFFEEWIETAEN